MFKKIFISFVLVITLAFMGCGPDKTEVEYPQEYFNATVISAVVDDGVTMTIESTGFKKFTVEVTVKEGLITSYEVTEHQETAAWGGVVIEDSGLIAAIIAGSANIDGIDLDDYVIIDAEADVTSSTTGEALIDVAKAAIKHFNDFYAE